MDALLINFIQGSALGMAMALVPTPLLVLLINESITFGHREGLKIALVPSITDLFFIACSVIFVSRIHDMSIILFIISIAGALFMINMGLKSWRDSGAGDSAASGGPRSIRRGILINLLNPSPYVFWFTVGAPMLIMQWKSGPLAPVCCLAGFYLFLIGIRAALALCVSRFSSFLNSRGYLIASRILSVIIFLFALKILHQGISLILPGSASG
jgi:threonine/homoserine/homoserine lactone efflux protein